MHIKKQPTKFMRLRNIFTSEVQLITTCKLPACRVYQASIWSCKKMIMLKFISEWFR